MIRLRPWWRHLTSLRLALVLFIILTAVIALSSLFPLMQPDTATDPVSRAAWLQAAHDRYGIRAGIYDALGLFDTFRSVWFWVLLGYTAVTTLACAVSRLGVVRSLLRFERSKWSRTSSLVMHLGGVMLILGVGWSTWYGSQTKGIILPPGTPIEISNDWPYTVLSEPGRLGSDVNLSSDPSTRLSILSGDQVLAEHELQINHPMFFDGRGLYLKSYGPALSLSGSDDNGDQLAMQLSSENDVASGQVRLVLPPGDTADVILPDLDAALHLATSSRAEPSQEGSYFVRATNLAGETIAAGVVQPGKDFEIAGKTIAAGVIQPGKEFEIAGGTLRLDEESYVEIEMITDPGFWPAIAGGGLILLGALLALVPKKPKVTSDKSEQPGQE